MRMKRAALAAAVCAASTFVAAQRPAVNSPPWAGDRFDVLEKSIADLQDAMQQRTVTAVDLVDIYLARIEAYDRRGPRINTIVALNPRARADAAALDAERTASGPRGPLHGIPVVVKDNFDVVGMPTTAGTLAFANLYPKDDAFQVRRLRDAGAVILGKTNLHELASGITTIGSAAGQTLNPYDLARNPGGSSGGTGAAIAANFAAAGLGTDTCGSIRIPASHNALVGLRPTFGLSSRDGVVPLSHSQDVAGPLARTIEDLATLLDATAGTDTADETTKLGEGRRPKSYRESLNADAPAQARIGVLTPMFGTAPEDGEASGIVRRAVEQVKKVVGEANVIEVSVPGLDELLRGSSVIDMEFKDDLAGYLATVPDAPVTSLTDILERGLHHRAVEASLRRRAGTPAEDAYRRAKVKRAAALAAVIAALEEHRLDALVYPTMRRKPALVGEPQAGSTCQLSASTGLPALSIPAGFTDDGLPIGIELLGAAFSEPRLLSLGLLWERLGKVRRPPFSAPALAGRNAPAPIAFTANVPTVFAARFAFDVTTGDLAFEAATKGVLADDMLGAWIHRGGKERGAAVYSVLGRGETRATGTIRLRPADHSLLREGRFSLVLYTRQDATGDRRVTLLPQ